MCCCYWLTGQCQNWLSVVFTAPCCWLSDQHKNWLSVVLTATCCWLSDQHKNWLMFLPPCTLLLFDRSTQGVRRVWRGGDPRQSIRCGCVWSGFGSSQQQWPCLSQQTFLHLLWVFAMAILIYCKCLQWPFTVFTVAIYCVYSGHLLCLQWPFTLFTVAIYCKCLQ